MHSFFNFPVSKLHFYNVTYDLIGSRVSERYSFALAYFLIM